MAQSYSKRSNKQWGGIIISPSCSCRCLFCGASSQENIVPLKAQKLNALKNLLEFKRKGITDVEISGGDPVEYNEICDLIKLIRSKKFKRIQLSTHGMRLNDDKFLSELIESGVTRIRVPLYGSMAKVHESITRKKGSFDATYNGLKKLIALNDSIEIQLSCLIMKQNKNDLTGICDLVKGLGVYSFYFSIPCVSDNDFSYVVPYDELQGYVRNVAAHCDSIDLKVSFLEIPHCIFGEEFEHVNNYGGPPDLGENCQPLEQLRTHIKDLPKYRLKTKLDICQECYCDDFCDGFFENYFEKFSVMDIKPFKKY